MWNQLAFFWLPSIFQSVSNKVSEDLLTTVTGKSCCWTPMLPQITNIGMLHKISYSGSWTLFTVKIFLYYTRGSQPFTTWGHIHPSHQLAHYQFIHGNLLKVLLTYCHRHVRMLIYYSIIFLVLLFLSFTWNWTFDLKYFFIIVPHNTTKMYIDCT